MSILTSFVLEVWLTAVAFSAAIDNMPVISLDESIRFMEENGGPRMATQDDFQRLQQAIATKQGQDSPPMGAFSNANSRTFDQNKKRAGTIVEINRKSNILHRLYQGDILLTNSIKWLGNVHYFFAPGVDAATRAVFQRAVLYIKQNTCINFVQTAEPINRIRVIKGDGCYSAIGKAGGVQDLSLGEGCEGFGIAVHELAHALGIEHEHSRSDRDQFITIHTDNIEDDKTDQFEKLSAADSSNFGIPYDYGSVMQYDPYSYSSNGKPTMVAKQERYQETMGSLLVAFYDLKLINIYYGCDCKFVDTRCENGGYLNPRDCADCICPDGFGGSLCSELPPGCGGILKATNQFQPLLNTLGDEGEATKLNFAKCHFVIQAPKGRRIVVVGQSFEGSDDPGCIYNGVEIKSQANRQLTGYRYCSTEALKKSFLSHDNFVPIITYNRFWISTVRLAYRIAPEADSPGENLTLTEEEIEVEEEEEEEG